MSRHEYHNVKLLSNASGILVIAIDTAQNGLTRDILRAVNSLVRRNRLTPPNPQVAQAIELMRLNPGMKSYAASKKIAGDYSLVRQIRYWTEKERKISHTKQVNQQEAEMKGENDGQSHVA